MAEYLIQGETLDDIADAINAKTGGSSAMTPAEMVTAIGSISGGGGEWTTDGIANGSEPNGNIIINSTTLANNAFMEKNIQSVVLSNFGGSYPYAQNVFKNSKITQFRGEKNNGCGQNWFYDCTYLISAVMPNCTYLEYEAFRGASNLEVVDCKGTDGITRGNVFYNCKKLQTLVLRSATLAALGNPANLKSTPFAGTGNSGLTGTLYVPSALVESYKTATNWSTFYSGGTMAVLPIEGSIYETQYADGTPIPTT